jgi:co-chaperonin GroES (HSP10)
MKKFVYNVPFTKSYGCVLIDVEDWARISDISLCRSNGKLARTNVTNVLATNYDKELFGEHVKKGDNIFIMNNMARAMESASYKISIDNFTRSYANLHLQGIIGTLNQNKEGLESIDLLYGKFLLEKVDPKSNSIFILTDFKSTTYRIVKKGLYSFDKNWNRREIDYLNVGDLVLVGTDSLTEIKLGDKIYYGIDEQSIAGKFENNDLQSIDNIILDQGFLMTRPNDTEVRGTIFSKMSINLDEMDENPDQALYNPFELEVVKTTYKGCKKGDRVLCDNILGTEMLYKGEKYFYIRDKNFVKGKYEY